MNPMTRSCVSVIFVLAVVAFSASAGQSPAPSQNITRVACLGDSITYGYGIEKRETNSYPAQLDAMLGDGWFVGNFGKNGATVLKKGHAPYWRTPQYKAALRFKPDIVVIKLGTNDSRPENIGRYKADFVSDYMALIRSFQELNSKPRVLICYSAPIYEEHKGMTDAVVKNEIIPLVAEVAKKTGVTVIDLYTELSNKKKQFPDGVHPNAEGAGIIAKAVFAAIKQGVKQ